MYEGIGLSCQFEQSCEPNTTKQLPLRCFVEAAPQEEAYEGALPRECLKDDMGSGSRRIIWAEKEGGERGGGGSGRHAVGPCPAAG